MRKTNSKLRILKSAVQQCCICGRPVYTAKAIHCLRCHKFAYCMKNRRVNGKAAQDIWKYVKRYGYVCYYTGLDLDLDDVADPLYFQFDHETPGDNSRIRLTCSMINEMKSDMDWKEFKYYIIQIARFLTTGVKIKKIKLKYWYRLTPKLS